MKKILLFMSVTVLSTAAATAQNVSAAPASVESRAIPSGTGETARNVLNAPVVSGEIGPAAAAGIKSAAGMKAAPAAGAVASGQPLAPNRKYMGAYTTDTYDDSENGGYGFPGYDGELKIAAYIAAANIGRYDGSTIVGMRFALSNVADVNDVFVYTVDKDGNVSLTPLVYQTCVAEAVTGWNYVTFSNTAGIDLADINGLLVGYSYMQESDANQLSAYPWSLVKEGTVSAPIYMYATLSSGQGWYYTQFETYGNLSVQLIVENDNFPAKDAVIQEMVVGRDWSRRGDTLAYAVALNNFGTTAIGTLVIGTAIDGVETSETVTAGDVTSTTQTLNGSVTLPADIGLGEHALTLFVKTVDGEVPSENTGDDALAMKFYIYDRSVARQKNLIEEFVSQHDNGTTYGTANIGNLAATRDNDIVRVAVHVDMSDGKDEFTTAYADYLAYALRASTCPSASFNRTLINGTLSLSTGYSTAEYYTETLNAYFNDVVDYTNNNPAFATVDISGSYDGATRQLEVTVSGTGVDVDKVLAGYGLTVFLTEDGITANQADPTGAFLTDYVHNNVLRESLTYCLGSEMNWNGDTYENTYSTTLDAGWNAGNMSVVAFIAPMIDINNADFYHEWVNNADRVSLSDIPSGVRGVSSDCEKTVETVRYNVAGQVLPAPVKGLNIIRMSDGRARKVIVK